MLACPTQPTARFGEEHQRYAENAILSQRRAEHACPAHRSLPAQASLFPSLFLLFHYTLYPRCTILCARFSACNFLLET